MLQLKEHDIFSRSQNDLYISHTIGITEALCGFKMLVTHLDGRVLVLNQEPGECIAPGMFVSVCHKKISKTEF